MAKGHKGTFGVDENVSLSWGYGYMGKYILSKLIKLHS